MPSALDVSQPFIHAEARAAGLSDRALRGPSFRKVFPNVYISSAIPDTLVVTCRAALRILPSDAVFSHHTAAKLWGGAVPDDPNVHVAFNRAVSCALPGIKVHRFNDEFAKDVRRHGLPVTSPEQTVLHLARPLDLVELTACADQLVRRRVTTQTDLLTATDRYPGQGRRLARQAALLCRDRVDSSTETRMRLLMVLAGLPEPEVNHALRRPDGTVRYRLDLSFPDLRIAIEYDGRWHEDPEQKLLDEARRADLVRRGWTVIVLRAEDLFETPGATVATLHAQLTSHGLPVPSVLDDSWRRHFPWRGLVA
ncbi:Protein of unknown function [Pedococcus dokdonensis]|uniref:DUF559 domain-containing protein n=1 Tax=Pedococcus dokdonensis TaxID=443156 RepID=A0A1H0RJF1_9MICO|nr:DUF559 domain-containing protein [Pedococcus dokdonensis]SDP29571.1 Protein of unknown function [Pedococcus dokdonensis]